MSLIEMAVIVGISSIILYTIASISNMGFQGLKHIRIGGDLQTVENLVSLNLSRPPTAQESLAKERVCRNSIVRPQDSTTVLDKYTGVEVKDIGIIDSGKKSILLSLNKFEYDISAKIAEKIDGPIAFKYPDENGVLSDFKYYLTQIIITGTKKGEGNLGGNVLRARVALGVITRPDDTFFDCTVDTKDPKRLCELLGGKYKQDENPPCLFTKLPVATDWSLFQNNKKDIFPPGGIYGENLLMLGDKTRLQALIDKRGITSKGVMVGGGKDLGVVLGQQADGATGFSIDYKDAGYLSFFADPQPLAPLNQYLPQGVSHIRSYFSRPLIFATCDWGNCSDTLTLATKLDNPKTISHGPVISGHYNQATKDIISGAKVFGDVEKLGMANLYSDGKWMTLARTSDAMGLWFMNDKNPPGRPNPALGGIYWGVPHPSAVPQPPIYPGYAGTDGLLVVKAYNKNDIIFQVYQPPPGTENVNCGSKGNLCTPMILRGDTGNVGIGGGIFNPVAKLTVTGENTLSGLFRNTVISANPDTSGYQDALNYLTAVSNDGTKSPHFVVGNNGYAVGIGRAGDGCCGVGLGITQGTQPRGTIFYETNPVYDRLRIHAYNRNLFLSVKGDPNSPPLLALISGSENVGVGTTTPSQKLDVAGNINASGALFAGGTQVCTASGCSAVPSDERLKKNIEPLDHSLEKILQLEGKTYSWKDPKKYGQGTQLGLLAQEVEKVFPEVVQTDETTGLKRVAYSYLIAPLIEAFRTIVDRVKVIETKITELLNDLPKIQESILGLFKKQNKLEQKMRELEAQNEQLKAYICAQDKKAPFCH